MTRKELAKLQSALRKIDGAQKAIGATGHCWKVKDEELLGAKHAIKEEIAKHYVLKLDGKYHRRERSSK